MNFLILKVIVLKGLAIRNSNGIFLRIREMITLVPPDYEVVSF